ncbi:hypothetical protein NQ314_018706 [Rhamnusium bicolor]|uniref:Uncharacterized protein n=1 Tax=Rhamnusium bicolor TaxID=1586634 RepID=A0AAV8WQG5_9CUCU|nr:hypothetical protein NQ314_018706 [Rhamnusium bicolor]
MWSCTHNNSSFLSSTAHWLSPEFRLEHAVLAMKPVLGSHTGENIAEGLNLTATSWDIPQSKIHVLVHDSGANMVKGVRVAGYASARCFIHFIQLVIKKKLQLTQNMLNMRVSLKAELKKTFR